MEDQDDTPPPPKSKIPGILLYVGVLAAGVAGGYGGFAFWGTPAAAGEAPAEHGEAAAAEAEAPAEHGGGGGGEHGGGEGAEGGAAEPKRSAIVNLGVFTVNLRGSGGGRVLRMEMQLDAGEASSAAIEERIPQLRDAVITAVSDYTWTELEGVDGKTRLRDELLSRLNGTIAPTTVKRLYFTQFVVQ